MHAMRHERGPLSKLPPTVAWRGDAAGHLLLLDQTLLPHRIETRTCRSVQDVWDAIRVLAVRGAPAIGVAGAYGLCLGMREFNAGPAAAYQSELERIAIYLIECRPTAVNLAWAVRRVAAVGRAALVEKATPAAAWERMLAESHAISAEEVEACRRIGEVGSVLIKDGMGVLTHCNAGALATVAYGTALAPMYVAHELGRRFRVYADETRPLLQGARLTAFELHAAGLDVSVLCDGAAAALMAGGRIQLVIVGADRIAANGDTANKIGTYGVAIAARHHGIPFYVAAPASTFDRTIRSGSEIPIEQRAAREVRAVMAVEVAVDGVGIENPAFDVTPAELITGFVTPKAVLEPVSEQILDNFFA
jgi:methylthioribose-1-phosphate isomerase